MKFKDCLSKVIEASEGRLNLKEASKVADEISSYAQNQQSLGKQFDDAVIEKATQKALDVKLQSIRDKRKAAINLKKKIDNTSTIDNLVAQGVTLDKALQSILVGMQSNKRGSRNSVAANQLGVESQYLGGVVADLTKKDLIRHVQSKKLNKEIGQELWQLNSKNGEVGITKNKEALEIAKVFHKYQKDARDRLNLAGAEIGELEGYITRQSHDQFRIKKAGFEKWRDNILPLLDESSFKNAKSKNEFLKFIYNELSSGRFFQVSEGDSGSEIFKIRKTGDLIKRLSQERVLHFKDAESWFKYNEQFGTSDLIDSLLSGLRHSANNIALIERLGTNPKAMFNTLAKEAVERNAGNENVIGKIRLRGDGEVGGSLGSQFSEVSGETRFIENPTTARANQLIRSVVTASKLGSVTLSAFADIPLKVSEMRFQGKGFFSSYTQSFGDLLRGRGSKEKRELASLIGAGYDGIIGSLSSRFTQFDDTPGQVSKMLRYFFKLSGLQWWTDVNKQGLGMMMSHHLGMSKNLNYKQLDDATKNIFNIYDIAESDWNVIRKTATKLDDGREYITADAILDIDDAEFARISNTIDPVDLRRKKNEIATKLSSYYQDRIEHGVLEPGARERAIQNQGTKKGTAMGEAIRYVMQFKSFPVSVISKIYGREIYAKGSPDIVGLAHLAVMSTVFGYLSMTAKDVAKGKNPRDPIDADNAQRARIASAAFLQGGGAGIFGDFLFGEYNRFGRDLANTLAGPAIGGLGNDVASNFSAALRGDLKAAKLLNSTVNNTPFVNLFYIRPALNYLFLYEAQEQLNPGYLRRMERRMEQENNQSFWLRPTDFVN